MCEIVLPSDDVVPFEDFLLCCGVTSSCFNMSVKIALVSITGMLEYRFVMSIEAREWFGSSGVS